MNMFTISILAVCAALYYIDFVYILKNKAYLFKKSKAGKRRSAQKSDAWLSFIIATISLSLIIFNFLTVPDAVTTTCFIIFVLLLLMTIFKGQQGS